MRINPRPGISIQEFCYMAVRVSLMFDERIYFAFNDTECFADPNDSANEVANRWDTFRQAESVTGITQ